MKKISLFFACLAAVALTACEKDKGGDEFVIPPDNYVVTISDPIFREFCLTGFIGEGNNLYGGFDLPENGGNGDGKIQYGEIKNVTYLDFYLARVYDSQSSPHGSIASLKGIEYFTSLEHLRCIKNKLTSLDLSRNIALKHLYCPINNLTTLNISKNITLEYIECQWNRLTMLDVSKNTKLISLACYRNDLILLDLSKNIELATLDCFRNNLATLDVSKNTNLKFFDCSDNKLAVLDVSRNTALVNLDCSENNLASLNLSKNSKVTDLHCGRNRISSIDVSHLGRTLEYFHCGEQTANGSIPLKITVRIFPDWESSTELCLFGYDYELVEVATP